MSARIARPAAPGWLTFRTSPARVTATARTATGSAWSAAVLVALAACTDAREPIVIDLGAASTAEVARHFEVAGHRDVRVRASSPITRERFLLAESVELSISPWQWRQWLPDGTGNLTNPLLFQTVDVARVDAPGPTRDAFLAAVTANAAQIAARTWLVPDPFRAATAEVAPNAKAPLVDLSPLAGVLASYPMLPRALAMIGCPRCHTDNADFVQTTADRRPSPFYDRELDARAARLDALDRGGFPPAAPFGPLQD